MMIALVFLDHGVVTKCCNEVFVSARDRNHSDQDWCYHEGIFGVSYR